MVRRPRRRPAYAEVFAEAGQKADSTPRPYTPTGIWADRALETWRRYEGLKIRTYDAAGVEVLSAGRRRGDPASWADTVPQLTTGGIDAGSEPFRWEKQIRRARFVAANLKPTSSRLATYKRRDQT